MADILVTSGGYFCSQWQIFYLTVANFLVFCGGYSSSQWRIFLFTVTDILLVDLLVHSGGYFSNGYFSSQ